MLTWLKHSRTHQPKPISILSGAKIFWRAKPPANYLTRHKKKTHLYNNSIKNQDLHFSIFNSPKKKKKKKNCPLSVCQNFPPKSQTTSGPRIVRHGSTFGSREVLWHQPSSPSNLHRCQAQRRAGRPARPCSRPVPLVGKRGSLVHGRTQLQAPPSTRPHRGQCQKAPSRARKVREEEQNCRGFLNRVGFKYVRQQEGRLDFTPCGPDGHEASEINGFDRRG